MFKTKRLLQATFLLVYICAGQTIDALTLTKENTTIATDLDNVLLLRLIPYFSVLKSSSWKYITTGKSDYPGLLDYLWYSDWKSLMHGGFDNFKRINGEHKYIEWMKKGVTKPAEFVRSIAQQKEIIPETLELYQKLHDQGFRFYTATNIGSIFFSDLQKRFPHVFNDTFIKLGMAVDYGAQNPIEKPDLRYFEMLKTKINPTGDKYILFIDDKKENVEAARKAGLLAIQFDKKLGAKKLAEDLKNIYGINLK